MNSHQVVVHETDNNTIASKSLYRGVEVINATQTSVTVKIHDSTTVEYRTQGASMALAMLQAFKVGGGTQQDFEYFTHDLLACTARVMTAFPEICKNPYGAEFVALMTKAEALGDFKGLRTQIADDMANNKTILSDMDDNQHEWRTSLSHNAFIRITEEGLIYSGQIIPLLAESLRLCIYDTMRTGIQVPIFCNEKEHLDYIEKTKNLKKGSEATCSSSTVLEVGVNIGLGGITPTASISGLSGLIARKRWRNHIKKATDSYLTIVRELHENSLEATTEMHFNPDSINDGSYDFIIANQSGTTIVRGNASGSGLHAILSCDHVIHGKECKNILASYNNTNSNCTMYKLENGILKKASSIDSQRNGIGWENVKTTQNAFTYCFGDVASKSGMAGGSWKFAKNGIKDKNPKEGFALTSMKDMLMGFMLRTQGSATGIVMHYPNIFYKNGHAFVLLHLVECKKRPIFKDTSEPLIHVTGKNQPNEWNDNVLTA